MWWLLGGSNTKRALRLPCVCNDSSNYVLHTKCALNLLGCSPALALVCCLVRGCGAWHEQGLVLITLSDRIQTHEAVRRVLEVYRQRWARRANWDATADGHRTASEWARPTCSLLKS